MFIWLETTLKKEQTLIRQTNRNKKNMFFAPNKFRITFFKFVIGHCIVHGYDVISGSINHFQYADVSAAANFRKYCSERKNIS